MRRHDREGDQIETNVLVEPTQIIDEHRYVRAKNMRWTGLRLNQSVGHRGVSEGEPAARRSLRTIPA